MELHQAGELGPGTSIWVWIVRLGKGKWWPGTVTRITLAEPLPIIDARFECRSTGKTAAAFIGISTTRMRYLERRNPDLKGADRPDFVPASILAMPERPGAGLTEVREPAVSSGAQVPARPEKRARSRRNARTKMPAATAADARC